MSYKDLEEARAKRAEKEAAKDAKGKGKSAMLEAEPPEPNIKVARTGPAPAPETARASVVQMSGTLVAEDEIVPEPWRALVARMY
jgi:hypothetical protein